MTERQIEIREGSINEAVRVSRNIPEFIDPHDQNIYEQRLAGRDHLILIAYDQKTLVGFKVGYDKFQDGSFYSWMGGIIPDYRRIGIAQQLADYQENYARERGYQSVVFKTRNRHKNMLLFGLNNSFIITSIEARQDPMENRIIMRKTL